MGNDLTVVGGGLAGSEAAWQAAEQGISVRLYEMRPVKSTPAHVSASLAELVCSNSLGATQIDKAPGLLKAELRGMGSLILDCAARAAVPAGRSLAVDRTRFGQLVTQAIDDHPNISLVRQEITKIPASPAIIATGPLTSDPLAEDIGRLTGREYLFFYDALAPIVAHDTIDMTVAFRASRYLDDEETDGDYINCPMNEAQYDGFVGALANAEQITLREFEREDASFFEGCLPVEVLAKRDREALRFGPMRPVGLVDPRTNRRPHAVVQLRQDDLAGTLYNLVGFQTNLRWGEQRRVLRMVPGLENAEIMRYGMMHRNTYVNSPALLQPTLQFRGRSDLFFAGQIVGVEGYVGNAATGLLAGINASRLLRGSQPVIFPQTTMVGALCQYITQVMPNRFQPMKANFGLLPLPEHKLAKRDRYRYYTERSLKHLRRFAREYELPFDSLRAEGTEILVDQAELPGF